MFANEVIIRCPVRENSHKFFDKKMQLITKTKELSG